MRILWVSNTPWSPSGYGGQCALFAPRLRDAGHDVAIAANWGLQGAALTWRGMNVYPSDGVWGNRTLRSYQEHHQADLTIALCDAWPLEVKDWPEGPPVALWAPIDHHPIPPKVLNVISDENIRPVAMSRDGQRWMRNFGLDAPYVPHGIDTSVFRPMPEHRDAVREHLGMPKDGFLIGMVGANRGNPMLPRKGFPQAFLAFSRFAKEHEDAWLYVHSDAKMDVAGGGIKLDICAAASGCPPDRIRFTDDRAWDIGMDAEHVAVLYQAFDVLLQPSMGEGFGIPIIEAQACGVPVIASDHSAMTELVRDTGWLVSGDPWWDGLQEAWMINPSIDSIMEQLENAYHARGKTSARRSAKCIEFAAQYDADRVLEDYWLPALEQLTGLRKVEPLMPVKPNRKTRRKLERVK